MIIYLIKLAGYAMVPLAEALSYKPESRGFDFRLPHWNFALI